MKQNIHYDKLRESPVKPPRLLFLQMFSKYTQTDMKVHIIYLHMRVTQDRGVHRGIVVAERWRVMQRGKPTLAYPPASPALTHCRKESIIIQSTQCQGLSGGLSIVDEIRIYDKPQCYC